MQTSSNVKHRVRRVLSSYWETLKGYKLWLFGFSVIMLFIAGTEAAVPFYYKKFFDALSELSPSAWSARVLLDAFIGIAALRILSFLARRCNGFLTIPFELNVMLDLKKRAFSYLIHHSQGFFQNNFTGALVQKVNRYGNSFERIFDSLSFELIPLVLDVFLALIIIYIFYPPFATILGLFIILFVGTNLILTKYKLPYDEAAAEQDSKISANLSDSISNHTTIRAFANFSHEIQRFVEVLSAWKKVIAKRWLFGDAIFTVQTFFFVATELLFFYYGIRFWQEGALTVGGFVFIETYLNRMIERLWNFSNLIRHLHEAIADASQMVEIFETPHEIRDIPTAQKISVRKGAITFENVSFRYHETREVLRNINLTIQPGEKIALVGKSGAGKSTIVSLLLRLFDVTDGKILIDGKNIQKATQESLRKAISFVPQDPVLFHRTLLENISYGKLKTSQEAVRKATKLAHCDEFIAHFPDKYASFVGERGVRLSGGERQRVVIARAILKNAPILILDEATSSLDSVAEQLIQNALARLMKNRTTIVIAHRLSTIRKMDRIIVLSKHSIREIGSHEELLQKEKSLYARLWKLQSGGFIQ
jgi:ATP-binding cassette subfamily B protein